MTKEELYRSKFITVDEALDMALRNIDTLDAGVPVLSMHAPFETTAKFDCYMTYRAMKAAYLSK